MSIGVRLDKKTRSALEKTAEALHTAKSKVIKRSLMEYCGHVLEERRQRPYAACWSGREAAGETSRSVGKILREAFGNVIIKNA